MGAPEPGNLAPPVRVKSFVPAGLAWKLNRLRCMTAAEIGHRVVKAAAMRVEKMGLARTSVPRADLTRRAKPWIDGAVKLDPAPYVAAAERIAAGRLDVFAMPDVDLGSPPRWNRDPKTGIEAPLDFGKTLDYRDAARVGDCKYLWEPNRHLQLVTLAQAYRLTGDIKYALALRTQLDSWFAACPYRLGPNWSSALEAGLRLINWALAWQLLGGVECKAFAGPDGEAFRDRWLTSVYQHAEFVSGHYSLHSSANNHLIGELAGVVTAALAWPHWDRSQVWLREAHAMLEREALLQNAPDGVNREQAVSYQQWELDLLLLPLLAAEANGHAFSPEYRARVEAMLVYVASIIDVGGNVPMFGDADDGYVVRLDPRDGFCRFRSLLATGAILFGRGDFKAKAGPLDDKTRWLFGAAADARYEAIDAAGAKLPIRRDFPDGGYYILGAELETPQEIRVIADAGPLGYREIAAHGHADALSFTLSVGGQEFFVDPGTFAYHTEVEWRSYFRGTAAHNTIRIDGVDQSQPGGNFMWLRKASATCSRWTPSADEDVFEGWHDGYLGLADPVTHRRRMVLDKRARRLTIEDTLEMEGSHLVELFFHCHEGCVARASRDGFEITRGDRTLRLRLPAHPSGEIRLLEASTDPIGGWISRRFDRKERAPTLVWRGRLAGRSVLRTAIDC
jgi:hypothetical protein